MNRNMDYEYELIAKLISGEISEEEQQHLNKWLSESEENRNLFEEIKKYEEFSSIYNDIKNIDVAKAKELTWYKIKKLKKMPNDLD